MDQRWNTTVLTFRLCNFHKRLQGKISAQRSHERECVNGDGDTLSETLNINSTASTDTVWTVLPVKGCLLTAGLYIGVNFIRHWSDFYKGGRAVDLHLASLMLAYSRVKVSSPLVLQVTYLVKLVHVFEISTLLEYQSSVCWSTRQKWMMS